MEAALGEPQYTNQEHQETKQAEKVIDEFRVGLGKTAKKRGLEPSGNISSELKKPDFWEFHWKDLKVPGETAEECQRSVCQEVFDALYLLGAQDPKTKSLKEFFSLPEDEKINLIDLLELTFGRQTRRQKEEAERKFREEQERQRQEEGRKRQEAEARRRAEEEQRRQEEETRRRFEEESRRQEEERRQRGEKENQRAAEEKAREEERRRKEKKRTEQSMFPFEKEAALFWKEFWRKQEVIVGKGDDIQKNGLRQGLERIFRGSDGPAQTYVETRELVRNLAIKPSLGLSVLNGSRWDQFLRERNSIPLIQAMGVGQTTLSEPQKARLRKARGKIAMAVHPDISSQYTGNTTSQEKEMMDVFFKWINSSSDSLLKPAQK